MLTSVGIDTNKLTDSQRKLVQEAQKQLQEKAANDTLTQQEMDRIIGRVCTEVTSGEPTLDPTPGPTPTPTPLPQPGPISVITKQEYLERGYYTTPESAAFAFGMEALPLTDATAREMMAVITAENVLVYKNGAFTSETMYKLGEIKQGQHDNVIIPTIGAAIANGFG